MSKTFFAQDGSWGDAEGIAIMDTDNWLWWWTDAMDWVEGHDVIGMANDLADFNVMGGFTAGSVLLEWVEEMMPELLDTYPLI